MLAWGLSYVLPSWERRALPATIGRLIEALRDHADRALPSRTEDELPQRLARRQACDTRGALAAAVQRSAAEPQAVQVPAAAVGALLDRGPRPMAQLAVVRMALSQHAAELAAAPARRALAETRASLAASLSLPAGTPADGAADDAAAIAPAGSADDTADDTADNAGHPDPDRADPVSRWPLYRPAEAALTWLLRRLGLPVHDARQIRLAAAAARVRAPAAARPASPPRLP